ncbi:MAG: hypothetical protein COA86_01005 [Kangiella sp.]|nr:MAG: hypothetical protein COA86_01005 [Kangiella sp.]
MNIREMQVIGAIYFKKYCYLKKISHPSVDEFFWYLLSLASAEDLPEWESRGCQLSLSGRGDELPADLEASLSEDDSSELSLMSELVCEIGLSQMYGATKLEEVRSFYSNAENLALKCGVAKINLSEYSIPGTGWGQPVSEETVKVWGENA